MTVGLQCSRSGALTWRAVAVGDCCLFVVRDNDLAISFPMTKAGEFNNVPSLISSNHPNNAGLWPRARQLRGECLPGDFIVLASDALGWWILKECESGGKPWQTVLSLDSPQQWGDWVRAQRAMRNDDTTLIPIQVESAVRA